MAKTHKMLEDRVVHSVQRHKGEDVELDAVWAKIAEDGGWAKPLGGKAGRSADDAEAVGI